MELKDAIAWAHRAEPAEVFIASHPRRTQNALWALVEEVERLTALCDEYRGEVEQSKSLVASLKEDLRHTEEHAESALTRARAEGMEEVVEILANWPSSLPGLREIIAAIRARRDCKPPDKPSSLAGQEVANGR